MANMTGTPPPRGPADLASPRLLRLEGAAIFFGRSRSSRRGWSWLRLWRCCLRRLGIIGYLAGPRTGAAVYDVVHFYGLAVCVGRDRTADRYPSRRADRDRLENRAYRMDRALGYG